MEFDPDLHVYRVDGVVWPSVTQALSLLTDFGDIPADVLKAAANFGTLVHRACHCMNTGEILPPLPSVRAMAYVDGYARFLNESGVQIIASEVVVVNRTLKYCGGVDIVGRVNGKVSVIDIKTSAVPPRTAGPQTAAYAAAWSGEPVQRRYCLHLFAAGYRLIPLTNPGDMSIFVSALNCHKFKTGA